MFAVPNALTLAGSDVAQRPQALPGLAPVVDGDPAATGQRHPGGWIAQTTFMSR
jgi:hypothetical protein